ncbi:MAG: aminoglycoside phosphotransferase family protein [Ruminococcaceae bacterium]|nr:aminoglycoside phosphotransferase family protein [Oscillospiraceae bacterium]
MELYSKLLEVSRLFRIEHEYLGYETIQVGNVNQTYKVNFKRADGSPKSYLIQNVNTYAFQNPEGLMSNIDKVTEHIRGKKSGQVALHFHHTADRATYVLDGENFWRLTNYVPSVTYNVAHNMDIVRNAGIAFGDFQRSLADFDINNLVETIPGFHQTRQRYDEFCKAIEEDRAGRVAQAKEEIDFLLSVKEQACKMTDMYLAGELPLRVTHNDTKINNVLFNPQTDEPMVIIDLDTVMPGLLGHDFGDAIRFAANFEEEDSRNLEKVGVNLAVFRAFTEGFLSQTLQFMTEKEIETLPLSCFVLAVELATRFLADYLNGDLYFNIKCPDHNLVRARCQAALAKDMLAKMDEMEKIVRNCCSEFGR